MMQIGSRRDTAEICLAKKIGAIISSACTEGSKRKSQEMSTEAKEHQIVALNKTHPCEQIHARDNEQSENGKIRRLTAFSSLSGIFSKGTCFTLRKLKNVKIYGNGTEGGSSLKTKVDVREEKTQEEPELFKKRILMGEKCRPLNASGVLHCDEQGILLPEDVL